MPLESATYLDDLNPSNPASTDQLGQGDDHIRLIKAVLQATFPNLTGAVTADQDELNLLTGSTALNAVPIGIISAWYGASGAVPSGWHVCDGTTGISRSDGAGTIAVPDLRNLVIMGTGGVAAQGTTFGATTQGGTTSTSGSHTHASSDGAHSHSGVTVTGHALTISEMPAHSHTLNQGGSGVSNGAGGTGGTSTPFTTSTDGGGAAHTHGLTWPVSPDGSHSHTISTDPGHTHTVSVAPYQPALSLHYIMKV